MGRYKRHCKTKTITKNNSKITYSTVSYVPKREKDWNTEWLMRDFVRAMKKHHVFSSVIDKYAPTNSLFYGIPKIQRLLCHNSFDVGNYLYIRTCGMDRIIHEDAHRTLLGRLFMFNGMLKYYRKQPSMRYLNSQLDNKDFLKYYVEEEVKNRNIKVYPNNMIFASIFGTIYAIIGYVAFLALLWALIGYLGCAIYCTLIAIFLLVTEPTQE